MTALERRVARNEFRNALAHAKTKQGRLNARTGTVHAESSDGGAGMRHIYEAVEVEPLWRKLWQQGRKTLRPKHRAVLDALLVDMRPRVAARIAGVGKDVVYECLRKIFKVHFDQCHQAYRALFDV